jgi:hypothetical protein
VFARHAREYGHLAPLCLSIVAAGGFRSLDLAFETPAQLETMWRDGEQQPLPNLVRAGRRAWCTYSMRQHSVASLCSRLLVRPAPRAARRYS